MSLDAAWAQRQAGQWPKWAIRNGAAWRIDNNLNAVAFGSGPVRHQPCTDAWETCSRDEAIKVLARILRNPTVAWAGYKAKVFVIMSDSRWWWGVRDTEVAYPSGHAPTEPAAREALAAWLLDNTMKETKQ
jgi:hypothetical protein